MNKKYYGITTKDNILLAFHNDNRKVIVYPCHKNIFDSAESLFESKNDAEYYLLNMYNYDRELIASVDHSELNIVEINVYLKLEIL